MFKHSQHACGLSKVLLAGVTCGPLYPITDLCTATQQAKTRNAYILGDVSFCHCKVRRKRRDRRRVYCLLKKTVNKQKIILLEIETPINGSCGVFAARKGLVLAFNKREPGARCRCRGTEGRSDTVMFAKSHNDVYCHERSYPELRNEVKKLIHPTSNISS